jgi:hypothetical protein
MMAALLFYAFATGIFSSRKIKQATYDSVASRFVAVNTHPDDDTIAPNRRRLLKELKTLFTQILLVAHDMVLIKLGSISLNRT